MALNPKVEGKRDSECTEAGESARESGDGRRNPLSAATSATSNQNGDQAGSEDGVMPEQEAPDRRRSGLSDARSSANSPLPGQRPAEELPRRNFQIPRKIKERKGLYQFLPPESREFEDLVKKLSSFYLDISSRGAFAYYKARLIHNELLEKEYVEKKRALKQDGRTEPELVESYCFLFPEKSKLPWICEKGLSVGHTRVTTLGNPSLGVYLSKYSDLLQMNPFEVGASGDIVIFKVMRGRLKTIHENMPKSVIEPNPKFDCHVSKNATRVTSLLSYRAFELTQQYYFEFAFDEIKSRPRHVCPYAVLSFQYKGKESAAGPMLAHSRFNSGMSDGGRGPVRSYPVWTGPLVNKGQELCHVCLRSTTRPYLPIKLPDRLELSRGMQLDQVKRKIPSVLFSWDTYRSSREVLKGGMSCSLFEVVDVKGKAGSGGSLSGLLHKLERDRMVLVKPLLDKGFLFLLSSAQMVNPNEQHGRFAKSLQALFIFQESRGVVRYTSRLSEAEPLSAEAPPPALACLPPFVPALHYALYKMRSNQPAKDLSAGVERQALEYLRRRESGHARPFVMHDYKQSLDERGGGGLHQQTRPNIDGPLRSYVHGPASYIFPLARARDAMQKAQQPPPQQPPPMQHAFHAPIPAPVPAPAAVAPEYSPVSDWGGSGGSDRTDNKPGMGPPPASSSSSSDAARRKGGGVSHSNGGQAPPPQAPPPQAPPPQAAQRPSSQSQYDKDKMKELLKLIQTHKKNQVVKEPGREGEGGRGGDGLKRKMEAGPTGATHNKHHRLDNAQSNGEPSRAPGDDGAEDSQSLTSVMESMGFYDTDLRDRGGSSSTTDTQRLLKILLDTLNKAMAQGAGETADPAPELPAGAPRRAEPTPRQECPEEETACSLGSPMSTCSMEEQPHSSDNPQWAVPSLPDRPAADRHLELKGQVPTQPLPEVQPQPLPQVQPQPLPEVLPQAPTLPLPQAPTQVQPQPLPQVQPQIPTQPLPQVQPQPLPQVQPQPLPQVQPQIPTLPLPQVQPQIPTQPLPEVPTRPLSEVLPQVQPQVQHQPPPQPLRQSQPQPLQPVPQPPVPPPGSSLDGILSQELQRLSSDIQSLMQSQHIYYPSRLPRKLPQGRAWLPSSALSEYVTPYVTPVPVQAHVSTLRQRMGSLIRPDLHPPAPAPAPAVPPPAHAPDATIPSSLPAFPHLPAPPSLAAASPLASPALPRTKAQPAGAKGSASKRKKPAAKVKPEPEIYSPSQVTTASPDASPTAAAPGATATTSSGSAPPVVPGLLFGQLKPEMFSSLVEIFKDVQKNTVKFYIHPGDEGEESAIGVEIKEYLKSLGNAECKPQSFLENSSNLDKLLIIIQNEDIAAHVHKIPALVSLKKCSTVNFAGVDSLDDVKNHTYNELFVSGGFIVSDEFVLNPDFITQDRLQSFLKFLEEQSSPEHPWQWKVHCKSQKKLKELGRLNSNAMGLLTLLTAYQKKHLVEFLPYHECDVQSRQAPDLDCLVKLQAQHTQQRHLIFLTERRFEMFLQYSRNGIVIASIDDIMNSFHSLIGGVNQNELPTPPSTVVNDECVEEEDMSLDSDEETLVIDERTDRTTTTAAAEEAGGGGPHPEVAVAPRPPPLPEADEFRPPLPDQLAPPLPAAPPAEEQAASSSSSLSYASLCDLAALKTAISQFKASSQAVAGGNGGGGSSSSAGGFAVNPHQSFLCPSTAWAPFPGYAASPAYPASPCSGTAQEQEYRGAAGPLASQPPLPLPLEVKPPPPPHLMHLYVPNQTTLSVSDPALTSAAATGGGGFSRGGATGAPPAEAPPSASAYPDPAGASTAGGLHSFAAGVTGVSPAPTAGAGATPPTHGQGDRTLGGAGEGVAAWGGGAAGNSTGEAPGGQGAGVPPPHGTGAEREWTDPPAGSQGGRTPLNCTDGHGAGVAPATTTRGGRPMGGGAGGGGYGCVGSVPGQPDGGVGPVSLGGYRGRGPSPGGGLWARPGRGHERGEGTGGWGYPPGRGGGGQDYYSDYT